MTEPASTAAGGFALYKLVWLGFIAFMAVLAAVVVMAMTMPRSPREFVVAIISTLVGSIGGGAFLVRWLEIGHWAQDFSGMVALGAVVFFCGLPAWVIVRGWFAYTEAKKGRPLVELISDLRKALKGES